MTARFLEQLRVLVITWSAKLQQKFTQISLNFTFGLCCEQSRQKMIKSSRQNHTTSHDMPRKFPFELIRYDLPLVLNLISVGPEILSLRWLDESR